MNEDPDPHDSDSSDLTDRIVSDWLDDGMSSELEGSPPSQPSPVDKRRAADLLWLNSLLEVALHHEPDGQSLRIKHAMTAIRNETTVTANPATRAFLMNRYRQTAAWLTAAVLVVCAGLWWQIVNPGRQAQAAISQIREATVLPNDREYLVTMSFAGMNDAITVTPDRILQATLFVRGGEAFVARAPAVIRPGEIWFGRDRRGAWFKPAIGPVLAGPGALAMQQRFLRDPDDGAPYLQMTTVLERLSDHYDVRILPEEAPPRGPLPPSTACQHVRGSLRHSVSHPVWLPEQIDIHADHQNGTVMRLVLAWNHETPSHLKEITFDFVQQSKMPDDWYRPEGRNPKS